MRFLPTKSVKQMRTKLKNEKLRRNAREKKIAKTEGDLYAKQKTRPRAKALKLTPAQEAVLIAAVKQYGRQWRKIQMLKFPHVEHPRIIRYFFNAK